MNILVGCEYSGRVRDAFRAKGHNAWSCDLLPSEVDGPHFQQDVFEVATSYQWDMGIFFPDCTYLCSSGLHWNHRVPGRAALTETAFGFVMRLALLPIHRIAIENPIGCLSSRWRKPDQIVHPNQYGDDASKSTCLWLKNLPPLQPTNQIAPRMVNGKKRWGNQTDSGQNKLGPSEDRWKERSRTYQGIADAMALYWG